MPIIKLSHMVSCAELLESHLVLVRKDIGQLRGNYYKSSDALDAIANHVRMIHLQLAKIAQDVNRSED